MSISKYYTTKNGHQVFAGYRARPRFNGKVIGHKTFGPNEKLKALAWHNDAINKARRGFNAGLTLKMAIERYLESMTATTNGRLYVVKALRCLTTDVPEWLTKPVDEFSPVEVHQLLRDLYANSEVRLGRKRAHLKREVETLHAAFEYAREELGSQILNPYQEA